MVWWGSGLHIGEWLWLDSKWQNIWIVYTDVPNSFDFLQTPCFGIRIQLVAILVVWRDTTRHWWQYILYPIHRIWGVRVVVVCGTYLYFHSVRATWMLVNSEIVTADTSGVVKIWDIRNFACVQTITVEDEYDAKKQIMSFATCASLHRLVVLARLERSNTCKRESIFIYSCFHEYSAWGFPYVCLRPLEWNWERPGTLWSDTLRLSLKSMMMCTHVNNCLCFSLFSGMFVQWS